MLTAIRAQFSVTVEEACPYLYRYVIDKTTPTEDKVEIVSHVLRWEEDLINCKIIRPIGLRIIAAIS